MLSTTTEYALRALVRMAQLPEGAAILGRDLAEGARLPANYLSKILLSLRNAGILTTMRGSGGGYRLKKKPEEIRLIEVVEIFEGPRALPACLLSFDKPCSDGDPCTAHAAWHEVRAAYVRFLHDTTVAQISNYPHARRPAAPGAAVGTENQPGGPLLCPDTRDSR